MGKQRSDDLKHIYSHILLCTSLLEVSIVVGDPWPDMDALFPRLLNPGLHY